MVAASASVPLVPDSEVEPRYLSLGQIARMTGKDVTTVWRWVNIGLLRHGVRIKLVATKFGQHLVTREDWEDFQRRLNPETWRKAAEEQERERKAAKRDLKRVKAKLGMD